VNCYLGVGFFKNGFLVVESSITRLENCFSNAKPKHLQASDGKE
jgi:hypothetical protein